MGEITKCPCTSPCMNSCPGNFVLVSATGPWSLAATIILEGTIYEGGNACQFRLCFNTADGTPISVTGDSSFALCGVEIPCQVAGVSPSLLFDFDACASILNPTLTGAADGTITLSGSLDVYKRQVIYGTYDPRLYTCGLKYLPYHKGSAGLSFSSRHSYGKQSFRRASVKLCAHLRHSFSYVLGFDHRNFLVYLLRKTP